MLADEIQGMQSQERDLRLVVAGDFNAFEFTDGYVDVLGEVKGAPDPAGALLPDGAAARGGVDEDLFMRRGPDLGEHGQNVAAIERHLLVHPEGARR